jgi:hypothetical protein
VLDPFGRVTGAAGGARALSKKRERKMDEGLDSWVIREATSDVVPCGRDSFVASVWGSSW